jgi:hypothetical protein
MASSKWSVPNEKFEYLPIVPGKKYDEYTGEAQVPQSFPMPLKMVVNPESLIEFR